ncbi:MAG: 2-hydroxychromene-2-carboxylate isomerase [Alphaproteobacteria bacterium]
MTDPVTLFFHFRSPYSWLAVERLVRDPLPIHGIPAIGIPESLAVRGKDTPNAPRLAYIIEDVARIAGRLDLPVQLPQAFDTDWIRPSAAFWRAQDQGHGFAFMAALFRRRFGHGADLGDPAVIEEAGRSVGLDGAVLAAAMDDPAAQDAVTAQARLFQENGVCGVPFFVAGRQKFWGQDRLPALRYALGLAQVKGDFDP